MDPYIAVMEQGSKFYWRQFSFPFLFVIPIYKVRHEGRSLLW